MAVAFSVRSVLVEQTLSRPLSTRRCGPGPLRRGGCVRGEPRALHRPWGPAPQQHAVTARRPPVVTEAARPGGPEGRVLASAVSAVSRRGHGVGSDAVSPRPRASVLRGRLGDSAESRVHPSGPRTALTPSGEKLLRCFRARRHGAWKVARSCGVAEAVWQSSWGWAARGRRGAGPV